MMDGLKTMKKKIGIICMIVCMPFVLTGCVDPEVKEVTEAIESIGIVTREDSQLISDTMKKYENLPDELKEEVEGYDTLVEAQDSIHDFLVEDAAKIQFTNIDDFTEEMKKIESENLFAQEYLARYEQVDWDNQTDLSKDLLNTYLDVYLSLSYDLLNENEMKLLSLWTIAYDNNGNIIENTNKNTRGLFFNTNFDRWGRKCEWSYIRCFYEEGGKENVLCSDYYTHGGEIKMVFGIDYDVKNGVCKYTQYGDNNYSDLDGQNYTYISEEESNEILSANAELLDIFSLYREVQERIYAMNNRELKIGMTTLNVYALWGEPTSEKVTKYGGKTNEEWVYSVNDDTRYVYFEDGIVVDFR